MHEYNSNKSVNSQSDASISNTSQSDASFKERHAGTGRQLLLLVHVWFRAPPSNLRFSGNNKQTFHRP